MRPYGGGKLAAAASRSRAGEETSAFLTCVAQQAEVVETLMIGSALKLCFVAEGRVDLYPRLGPTYEWDIAAGQCVVECAGGWVTDLNSAPLRYNKPSLLNPWFLCGAGDHDWSLCLRAVNRQHLPHQPSR